MKEEQEEFDRIVKLRKIPNFKRPKLPEILYAKDYLVGQVSTEFPAQSPQYFENLKQKAISWQPTHFITENDEHGQPVQREKEKPFPENSILIDVGSSTQERLVQEIKKAQKIAWFDNLTLSDSPHLNISNTLAAKTLHAINQEKRDRIAAH